MKFIRQLAFWLSSDLKYPFVIVLEHSFGITTRRYGSSLVSPASLLNVTSFTKAVTIYSQRELRYRTALRVIFWRDSCGPQERVGKKNLLSRKTHHGEVIFLASAKRAIVVSVAAILSPSEKSQSVVDDSFPRFYRLYCGQSARWFSVHRADRPPWKRYNVKT